MAPRPPSREKPEEVREGGKCGCGVLSRQNKIAPTENKKVPFP